MKLARLGLAFGILFGCGSSSRVVVYRIVREPVAPATPAPVRTPRPLVRISGLHSRSSTNPPEALQGPSRATGHTSPPPRIETAPEALEGFSGRPTQGATARFVHSTAYCQRGG